MSPVRQARQWWLPCGWLELWTCLHRRADRARLPLARELFWAKCRGDPRHILGQSDVWPIPSVVSTRDRAGKRCCLPLAMIVILQPGFFTLEDMSKFDMSPPRGHAQRVAIALTTSCEQTEQTEQTSCEQTEQDRQSKHTDPGASGRSRNSSCLSALASLDHVVEPCAPRESQAQFGHR